MAFICQQIVKKMFEKCFAWDGCKLTGIWVFMELLEKDKFQFNAFSQLYRKQQIIFLGKAAK
jgi:hypothetical protein